MMTSPRFYLVVGSILSESVTTKITTAGNEYRSKKFASNPENWRKIIELLKSPDLIGAIVKLTTQDFRRIYSQSYSKVASALFAELKLHSHLIAIHEDIVGAGTNKILESETELDEDAEPSGQQMWEDHLNSTYFTAPERKIRDHVLGLISDHDLTFATYKRNSEASVLATSFIEDTQSNLLFRMYVPSGRMYEAELSRLLEMFHDWLSKVKHQTVRQGGYKTPSGRVIEFFGEPELTSESVSNDLEEFAHFLGLLDNPRAAKAMLNEMGVDNTSASDLTARYAKEARRVLLDTKHERDRRLLAIQQQLESELSDVLVAPNANEIENLVRTLIPVSPFSASSATQQLSSSSAAATQITINQQVFHHIEGVVAQNINGGVSLGPSGDLLIKIIRETGGDTKSSLEADARELADSGAPTSARIGARQRLKDFLNRNVQRLEQATFRMAWKWVEAQFGGGTS